MLVKLLDLLLVTLNLFLINKNKSWWKWLLSGYIGDLFNLSFLIMENKVSKAGYQSNKTMKNGEIIE